uniref:hypothetical protein n=1 Tax=Interfilum massjukiae TaxID=519236 RepID=UPI00286A3362|nr:hypothetical protein RMD53_pgp036 [Interfilum massjukiae]YP_010932500.1 hypothetical protein RMD53_pgp004 [Interfilum massjukiae]WKT06060.1 hypothetical protein [Interfilum massjukiae]WKT06061.1 hypothetical protein [Interfilum massjukiae]
MLYISYDFIYGFWLKAGEGMPKYTYNPPLEQNLVLEKQTDSAQQFDCCNSQQDPMALQRESTSSRQLATVHPASECKGNSTQPKTFFQKAFVCALLTGGLSISNLFFPLLCRKAIAAPVSASVLSVTNKVKVSRPLSSGTRVLYQNKQTLRFESQARFTPQLKVQKLPRAKAFASNPHSRLRKAYSNIFVIGNPSCNKIKPRRGYKVKRFLLASACCASKNPKNLPHVKSFGLDSHSVLSHTNRNKFVSGSPSDSRFHQMHEFKRFAQDNDLAPFENPYSVGTPEWTNYNRFCSTTFKHFPTSRIGWEATVNFYFIGLKFSQRNDMEDILTNAQIEEIGTNIAKMLSDERRSQAVEERAKDMHVALLKKEETSLIKDQFEIRKLDREEQTANKIGDLDINHKEKTQNLDVDLKKATIAKTEAETGKIESETGKVEAETQRVLDDNKVAKELGQIAIKDASSESRHKERMRDLEYDAKKQELERAKKEERD